MINFIDVSSSSETQKSNSGEDTAAREIQRRTPIGEKEH
jgi:hypothetical protein